ncbi:MAG: hypothetical protein QM627_01745, partial [Luteolibacter sp.]
MGLLTKAAPFCFGALIIFSNTATAQYVGVGRGPGWMEPPMNGSYYQSEVIGGPKMKRRTIDTRKTPVLEIAKEEIWNGAPRINGSWTGIDPHVTVQFYNGQLIDPEWDPGFGIYFYPWFIPDQVWGLRIRNKESGTIASFRGYPLSSSIDYSPDTIYSHWTNIQTVLRLNELEEGGVTYELLGSSGEIVHTFDVILPTCDSCKTGVCQLDPKIGSVDYAIPLGISEQSSGIKGQAVALRLYAEQLPLAGRESLALVAPQLTPSIVPTYDTNEKLVSLRSDEKLAVIEDIAVTEGDGYGGMIIRISSDYQNPASTIFRTVTIKNRKDSNNSDYLECDDENNGKHTITIYRKSPSGAWIMETGNGLRRETRSESETTTQKIVRTKVELRVAEATGSVEAIYETTEDVLTVYEKISNSWREISKTNDPDGLALSTITSYYTLGEDSSPDGSASSEGRTNIKRVIYPNGEIEDHFYIKYDESEFFDTAHIVRRSSAGSQQARETITESYSGLSPVTGLSQTVSRVTERVSGEIVSRSERLKEARLGGDFTEDRIYSGPGMYTSTFTLTSYGGEVTTINPDGTATVSGSTTDWDSQTSTATITTGRVTNDPSSGNPQIEVQGTTETITDQYGEQIATSSYRYKDGTKVLLSSKLAVEFDGHHRATKFEHESGGNGGTVTTEREYGCCGLMRERDMAGIDTFYAYDALGRTIKTNRAGVTTETVYQGRSTSTHRYAQMISSGGFLPLASFASSANEISRNVVNIVGDTIEEWSRSPQDGTFVKTTIATAYNIGGGIGKRVVTTPPAVSDDGSTIACMVDDFYLDGSPASSTGNLGTSRSFRYFATPIGRVAESFYLDGSTEKENTFSQSDWAGREVKTTYASDLDGAGGNDHADSFYNVQGQLVKTIDPDGVTMLYGYNAFGERTWTAQDLNGNGIIDLAIDRVSQVDSDLAQRRGGEWVMRSTTKVWQESGSNTAIVTAYEDSSLDGLRSWSIQYPTLQSAETRSVTTLSSGGSRTTTVTRPDGTSQTTTSVNGLVSSSVEKDSEGNQLYQTSQTYDSLNRPKVLTDSRSGTITFYYVNDSTDTINRSVDHLNREVLITYDHRGRRKSSDLPDTIGEGNQTVANVSTASYFPDGNIREKIGDGDYRTTWTYDYAGRATTMTTYGTSQAVTRWIYDSARGFLIAKRLNSPTPGTGTGPTYAYTPGGRLKTRTQARLVGGSPLVTSYHYGSVNGGSPADLDQVTHSDGTPGFSVTLRDRLGRAKGMQDFAGTYALEYASHGVVKSETITSGLLSGKKSEQDFDALLRPKKHDVSFGAQSLGTTSYRYSAAGGIREVSGNGQTAVYDYHPGKRVLELVSYRVGSGNIPWLQNTRAYDSSNRLTRMTTHVMNAGANKAIDHHAYSYDALDRISSHSGMDGSSWHYRYNATGEVVRATGKLPGGSTDQNGRDYRYRYDGIGNRTLAEQSRSSGQTPRQFSYTPDALNRYTALTHPDFVDIVGFAASLSSVTVNGQSAPRQDGYFRKELSGNNSTSPQWIEAEITDGATTTDGSLPLPAASVAPTYDTDGNLLSDGLWNYTWDAENRLIRCERTSALVTAGAPYLRLEYDYDSQGRRIRSSTFTSTQTAAPSSQTLFIFQGWKCIAELDGLNGNQAIRKYTWGLDVAGDAGDNATGNIGALLWLEDSATSTIHVPLYDKQGNVRALVDATTRKRSATYEYDAFGQLIVCHGDYAKKNPFTYSTKFTEYSTGLCYYGYRWYTPKLGRW